MMHNKEIDVVHMIFMDDIQRRVLSTKAGVVRVQHYVRVDIRYRNGGDNGGRYVFICVLPSLI